MPTLTYNKRATFEYDLLETFEAGLVLLGVEVKSVRAGQISLRGAFVTLRGEHPYLTNATIPPWQPANTPEGYNPTRPRRLLLKAAEEKYLRGAMTTQGLTVVPVRVYTKKGKIKLEIALARGKRQYRKKEDKKSRDIARDVARLLRGKENE